MSTNRSNLSSAMRNAKGERMLTNDDIVKWYFNANMAKITTEGARTAAASAIVSWRGLHTKGARTAAAPAPGAAPPALMSRAAHSVEARAVVRIEVAVNLRPSVYKIRVCVLAGHLERARDPPAAPVTRTRCPDAVIRRHWHPYYVRTTSVPLENKLHRRGCLSLCRTDDRAAGAEIGSSCRQFVAGLGPVSVSVLGLGQNKSA
jgi:hypothetical protein